MNEENRNSQRQYPADDEMEINLMDLFLVLWRAKWLIIGFTLIAVMGAVLFTFRQERVYQAEATIAVSRPGFRVGLSQEGMLERSVLLSILDSTHLAREVAEELKQAGKWNVEDLDSAARSIQRNLKVEPNRDQTVIDLKYSHTDPQLARDIIESTLNAFIRLNQDINLTEAAGALEFIELRLEEVEADLSRAEENLQNFQNEHRIYALSSQAAALVDAYMRLGEKLRDLEFKYNVERETLAPNNPELRRLRLEKEEVEAQIRGLEKGMSEDQEIGLVRISGELSIPLEEIPRLTTQLARLTKEVEIQRETYAVLRAQGESLKIEASKSLQVIRLIDPPLVPDSPMGRGVVMKGAVAGVAGFMVAVIIAFILNFLRNTEWDSAVLQELPFLKRWAQKKPKKKG